MRLSGLEPYSDIQIVETGLRPGEKLYEELLVKDEGLGKTDNELIFIEKDEALSKEELKRRLEVLQDAVAKGSNNEVREALRSVVPTFKNPEQVNRLAEQSEEFKTAH